MSRNKKGLKVGRGSRRFVQLFSNMLDHANYAALTPRAVKLLVDVARQFNGKNNGDLCVTLSVLADRGWTSNDQMRKALAELLHYEFLVLTRQGGRNRCSLFALGWQAIDDCRGKLDLPATNVPPNGWKKPHQSYKVMKNELVRPAVFGKAVKRTS